MNKKVCGQKNELDENEKIKFQEKLNNKYKIYSQLGITGTRTSAYLMQDETGTEYVLKIPNEYNDIEWIKSQKNTIEKCHKSLNGYDGDVYIPTALIFDNDFIVESYVGAELTEDVYNTLPEKEKNKIINDFAYFFYYLHTNNNIGIASSLQMFNKPTLEEVFDYLQSAFDEKQKLYFNAQINLFNNRDISDEITVMTHADIRSQNILYDKKQKKLAVIDFELIKERNIYHDFVPFAAASFRLPYRMLFEIVDKYNLLAKNKKIVISVDKVKLFHVLGVFHEYGRCAIFRNDKGEQVQNTCHRILKHMKSIEEVYLYGNFI